MKILFIGDLRTQSRSLQRYNTLIELGFNVLGIMRDINFKKYFFTRYILKITNIIGYPWDVHRLNKRVLITLEEETFFDVIWLDKPLSLKDITIKYLKNKYSSAIFVYNTEDDMMQKHNQSKYFLNSIKYIDIFFTTKSYNLLKNELPSLGAKNIYFFNNTFDYKFHRPIQLSKEDKSKFSCDVSFIGTYEKDRAKVMLYLAENGIKIRLYGNGWKHFLGKNKNLEIMNKTIYGDDFIKGIVASRINISFLRKANRDVQTNRTMEIPACEAFMITERTEEHISLFQEGIEAEFFDSKKELLEKIIYYLSHEKERAEIANNARLRCLNSGYDMKSTLEKMIRIVKGRNES